MLHPTEMVTVKSTHKGNGGLDPSPAGVGQSSLHTLRVGSFEFGRTALDAHAVRILLGTDEGEASAFEFSRRFGIPPVACFRRLRDLEEMGLAVAVRSCRNRMDTRSGCSVPACARRGLSWKTAGCGRKSS